MNPLEVAETWPRPPVTNVTVPSSSFLFLLQHVDKMATPDRDDCHAIRASSSDLEQLLDLTLPSPILTPEDNDWNTSGYIPISFSGLDLAGFDDGERNELPPTESSKTVGTIGTFGPSQRHQRAVSGVSMAPTIMSLHLPEEHEEELDDNHVVYVDPPTMDSPFIRQNIFPQSSFGRISPTSPHTPDCDTHQFRIPVSPTYTNVPSPSISQSSWTSLLPSALSPKRLLQHRQHNHSLSTSTPRRGKEPTEDGDETYSPRPVSPSPSTASLSRSDSISRPSSRESLRLPDSLAWLKQITVVLLIDQEGFREIHPIFKYAGYSTQGRAIGGGPSDSAIVSFMPVKRGEPYRFHYAPFDGLPILRRVMVNRDESRDHISRQATLGLKANGVYTVHGTETTSSLPNDSSNRNSYADMTKLKWRFDYLVSERRDGAIGNREGERLLTPLTFSCSPLLLHHSQAKKVKLMYIVRKTVIPNLVAEKVEPPLPSPTTPSRPGPLLNSKINVAATYQDTPSTPLKSRIWGLHRRAQSHVVPPDEENSTVVQKVPLVKGRDPSMRTHRRASSAGEQYKRSIYGSEYLNSHPLPAIPPPAQHIISPSQLSQLMTNMEANPSANHSMTMPVALPAPPRVKHSRV